MWLLHPWEPTSRPEERRCAPKEPSSPDEEWREGCRLRREAGRIKTRIWTRIEKGGEMRTRIVTRMEGVTGEQPCEPMDPAHRAARQSPFAQSLSSSLSQSSAPSRSSFESWSTSAQ
jgi:hypothetical protein